MTTDTRTPAPGAQAQRPILRVTNAGYGKTPDCPQARFTCGDIVKIRNRQALSRFPRDAVVASIVPPGTPPEYALADLLGEPRPLMITKARRIIQYILVNEGDPKPYLIAERDLLPSGRPPVEIGSIARDDDD